MKSDHDSCITTLRMFNRVFTKQVGLLDDSFLGTGRPLGPSRVLFELGSGPTPVHELRRRLGLDSGYFSRLLRSLESEGLIRMEPDDDDRRRRIMALTGKGRKAWQELDVKSDERARRIVEPLSDRQRNDLDLALRTVSRLISAATISFVTVSPTSADALRCLTNYFAELDETFEGGFDPGDALTADAPAMSAPTGTFVIVYRDSTPIACGALVRLTTATAEIKRMWVDKEWRGLAIAPRLLRHLEHTAAENGYKRIRLDMNRTLLDAIALYERSGYRRIARYNNNPYAHAWFEKGLTISRSRTNSSR